MIQLKILASVQNDYSFPEFIKAYYVLLRIMLWQSVSVDVNWDIPRCLKLNLKSKVRGNRGFILGSEAGILAVDIFQEQ
jgi:hypothetical protein